MKKLNLLIPFILMLFGALTACQAKAQPDTSENTERTVLAQMREYRLEYAGDSTGVSKLLGFLPAFDENYYQNMFAVKTDAEPYGLSIYYEPAGNSRNIDMSPDSAEDMTIYAGYLLDCIDNLGYVEFAYRTTASNNELDESKYTVLVKAERPDREVSNGLMKGAAPEQSALSLFYYDGENIYEYSIDFLHNSHTQI